MDNKAIETGGRNPYIGLFSYRERDKDLFYGRKTEQRDLFRLVKHNFLTVIFGKSGIGKTSLLNAGLFPKIRENGFLPIKLRLDYSPQAAGLTHQVREGIKKELDTRGILPKKMDGEKEAEPLGPGETLWEYFHRVRHFDVSSGKEITPVLVFDQFEEIFTLGKNREGVDGFLDELYYLIENQFPESVKERLLNNEKILPFAYSDAKPNVRVLISLREDYLPHLNALKSRIRSIDRITFRVLHLTGKQGREIIGMPGGITDENVIDSILHMFYPEGSQEGEDIPDEKLEIEPSILSLLCFQLLEKEKEGVSFITQTDKNQILADFYRSVVDVFPEEVETFIESNLLTEGGFRTPYYLERSHPMGETVDTLVDRRILRKVHYGEKEHIEIIHDVLAPVIKEKRNTRLEVERKQKLQEELKKRNKQIMNRVVIIAAIVSILFALFAFERWVTANKQFKIAQANRLTTEAYYELPRDNVKAIRIAEAAYETASPHPSPRLIQVLIKIADSKSARPFYNVNMQHTESVYSAVFSPDGSRILTASRDKTAKLWDLQGNPLAQFKHNDSVYSAVFSPDGSRILTASDDHTAKLWDLQGNPLAQFKHNDRVYSAVFSPDGSRILTASADKTAKLWDLQGNPLAQFRHNGPVSSAVFSPDGSRILTRFFDTSDTTAKFWDLQGNPLAQFNHNGPIYSAVFSPDGSRILTASRDKTVKLWNLKRTRKPLAQFKLHDDVNSVVFSPDGSRILTRSSDTTARLWDLEGNFLAQFRHDKSVSSAVFSPDGSRILTTSDETATLWDLKRSLTPLAKFKHNGPTYSAVFSPDGSQIVTASGDTTAKLWDLKRKPLAPLRHNGPVYSAVFSPDGSRILTTSIETAKLWDLKRNLLTQLKHNYNFENSAVFSPDGSRVLTLPRDNTAQLWDLKRTRKPLAQFEHDGLVYSAVFSPDGSRILTASQDTTVKLWDLQGNTLAPYKHNSAVASAVFSPDGSRILTASWDNNAKLLDLNGKTLAQFEHDGPVYSAVFSPDGSRILTASQDTTVKLWDLKGNPLSQFKHNSTVRSAVFSPDGSRILTRSSDTSDTTAKLWDLKRKTFVPFKHDKSVSSAVFSPDGRRILTVSYNTAKLWDLEGNLLRQFKHPEEVYSAVFSPDGSQILIASYIFAKLRYTPEGLIQWLKTADIPQLTKADKERLEIE